MTTIRPATADAAAAIAHVQVETWRSAYRGIVAAEFLDSLSEEVRTRRWREIIQHPEQIILLAEIEGHGAVGFANGGPERDGREDYGGELYGLYVRPEWYGRGIGRRLLATVARWLNDSGCDTMMVWVLADNPFRRFYEHLGGRLIDQRKIEVGEQKLDEVAYGWDDVRVLAKTENAS